MKKVVLLCLVIPLLSFGQKEKKVSTKESARLGAIAQIKTLHNGILLVRLSARKNTIDAMRKVGKNELADKTEQKQKERNQLIVDAFNSNFDFCKVYFFYSEQSKYFINNQLDSVVFLNAQLQEDASIKIDKDYLTAELGTLQPSTKNYSDSTYFEKGAKAATQPPSSEISLTGLIIKDAQLNQLRNPFPYYIREYKGLPFQRAINKMVMKMNLKLEEFSKKNL